MAERIDALRGLPVIGKHYLVPTVQRSGNTFPVLLPGHVDPQADGLFVPHFHVDGRFADDRTADALRRAYRETVPEHVASLGLSEADERIEAAMTMAVPVDGARPVWRTLSCRRSRATRRWIWQTMVDRLEVRYGSPAIAVRKGKRTYCPHMGADLTGMTPDAAGCVQCPMHQLSVRVA